MFGNLFKWLPKSKAVASLTKEEAIWLEAFSRGVEVGLTQANSAVQKKAVEAAMDEAISKLQGVPPP